MRELTESEQKTRNLANTLADKLGWTLSGYTANVGATLHTPDKDVIQISVTTIKDILLKIENSDLGEAVTMMPDGSQLRKIASDEWEADLQDHRGSWEDAVRHSTSPAECLTLLIQEANNVQE